MDYFRVCKNEYDFYKIQRWVPPANFFFFSTKGKWEDSCFTSFSSIPMKFDSRGAAERQIRQFKNAERKHHDSFVCDGEV